MTRAKGELSQVPILILSDLRPQSLACLSAQPGAGFGVRGGQQKIVAVTPFLLSFCVVYFLCTVVLCCCLRDPPPTFSPFSKRLEAGDLASWLLDKVVVKDLDNGKRYEFLVGDWIGLDGGKGSLHRDLMLQQKEMKRGSEKEPGSCPRAFK